MKTFLKKIIQFLSFPVIVLFVLFFTKNILVKKYGQFTISKDHVTLIIGSSLGECAFNDKILPATKNLAQSGEAYYYTYKKLSYLLESNHHIENIVMSISNGSIHKSQDNWIWGEAYLIDKFTKCSFLLNGKDFLFLAKNNLSGLIKSIPIAMLKDLYVLASHRNYVRTWGGFLPLDHVYTPTEKGLTSTVSNDNLFSDYEIQYLKKIIELGESKGIKIFLVRTPMFEGQTKLVDEDRFLKFVNENLKEVIFIDHLNYDLEKEDFADRSHLNASGAEKYSNYFKETISW